MCKIYGQLFLAETNLLHFLFQHLRQVVMVLECSLHLFLEFGNIQVEVPLRFLDPHLEDGGQPCPFVLKVEESELVL
jgi:hypothetical protein